MDDCLDLTEALSPRLRLSSCKDWSNESLDSLSSDSRTLERVGSLRGKRVYGSVDQGRSTSPLTPGVTVQRSSSALDPAAARRAAVRQQYSQNCRSKIQRTGSLRRNSDQPLQRTGSLRRSSEQTPRLPTWKSVGSPRSNSIA